MKQMLMMKRTRTRSSIAHSKQTNSSKANSFDSSQGLNRPTIQALYEKNTNSAREAMTTGDRVLAESYYQQAEHYLRLMNEVKENQQPTHAAPDKLPSSQIIMMPDINFENSIEEELSSMAQQPNLL